MRLAGLLGILGLTALPACESWPMKANPLFNGCSRNADCPSGLCVDYQVYDYPPGSCVADSDIIHVAIDRCVRTDMGAQAGDMGVRLGDRSAPYCQIIDAIRDHAQGKKQIIQVEGSSIREYESVGDVRIRNFDATIIGPWADPERTRSWSDKNQSTATIKMSVGLYEGNSLVIDGFEIKGDGSNHAVVCGYEIDGKGGAAKLSIRRVVAYVPESTERPANSQDIGIYGSYGTMNCELLIDRVKLSRFWTGIKVNERVQSYLISNSLIFNNEYGVHLIGAKGGFVHNNVIGNLNGVV